MKIYKKILAILMLGVFITPYLAQAADGNWKKGRIYYRMVCTACHKDFAGGAIPPSVNTKAEWADYLTVNSHDKGKDTVSYYAGTEYKQSIKATNKAAAKFMKVPEDKLMTDIKAFVIHGAKDSDNPARCN